MHLPYDDVHPIADPLYGYLRITVPSTAGEVTEAALVDDQWMQRLKRIHQLQSSWWVFPSAEHSRFAHSLGTMHLSGQIARQRRMRASVFSACAGRFISCSTRGLPCWNGMSR